MATKPRLALSFDVEATGSSPANGSCVMLGIVGVLEDAIAREGDLGWIEFERQWSMWANDGTEPRCWSEFWTKHMDVWAHIEENGVHPSGPMAEVSDMIKELRERYDVYWVAWPAAFDWQWLKFIYEKYGPEDRVNIGYKAECMNGYENMMPLLGVDEMEFAEFIYPKTDGLQMTHFAVDDARNQAYIFLRMREYYRGLGKKLNECDDNKK